MATVLTFTIDLSKHALNGLEALHFRNSIEDTIEAYGIGEVVGAGGMVDGSSVDLSLHVEKLEQAMEFLNDYLTHCGVWQDTTFTTAPRE